MESSVSPAVSASYEAVDAIYLEIDRRDRRPGRFGLTNGYLGLSLFYYLYGVHTGDHSYFRKAGGLFDKACDQINRDMQVELPRDFADLGSVAQLLIKKGVLGLDPDRFLEDMDEFILGCMRHEIRRKNLQGFANGAVGCGLYFLHRAKSDPGRFTVILNELVTVVMNKAGMLFGETTHPAGAYEKDSLSEGKASVLLFLAAVTDAGLATLHGPPAWLGKAAAQTGSAGSALSDRNLSFEEGTLGIGYAMLRAGTAFRQDMCIRRGLQVLRSCTRHCMEPDTSLAGTTVRHGAAGAALVFDKVYRITGDPLFRTASRQCHQNMIRFIAAGAQQGDSATVPTGFTEGFAGIGATLIKGIQGEKANFDELLWIL